MSSPSEQEFLADELSDHGEDALGRIRLTVVLTHLAVLRQAQIQALLMP